MKIIGVYCPYCGENTLFDKDSGKKQCFCVHCGKQIVLDDEVIRSEPGGRIINEANPQDVDIKDQIRLKELEADKRHDIHRLIRFLVPFVVVALYILGFAIFVVIPFQSEGVSPQTLLLSTGYLCVGIFGFGSDMFKNRKDRDHK